jgi:MFS family permease
MRTLAVPEQASRGDVGAAVLTALFAAEVLVMIDGTVVGVALPVIQRQLGIAATDLQWVVTAYTIALGSFLLVGGRAADRLGRRRVLVCGLALFSSAARSPRAPGATGHSDGCRPRSTWRSSRVRCSAGS